VGAARGNGRTGGTDAAARPSPVEAITDVVLDILESGGYDAVQLREVARRAHVSLATVYRLFTTRDGLIVATIQRWMATNCYVELTPPAPEESLYDGLMRTLRCVFEPWERSPRVLEAYHRARSGPARERLDLQGMNAVVPIALALLADADPIYARDVGAVLTAMAFSLIADFAEGTLGITEILPTLERAVYRLTTNNEPEAAAARPHQHRPPPPQAARRGLIADL
jgi:AcrR family transcriptional regulator